MEIGDFLRVVRRRWVWLVVSVVLFTGTGLAMTLATPPTYASSAQLFVSTSETGTSEAYQGGLFSAQRVKSYADLIKSRELAQSIIDRQHLDLEPQELAAKAEATAVADTVNLVLTVRDADPHEAQRLTQAYAEGLSDLVRQLETPPGGTQPPIKATIVDSASFSDSPVSPDLKRNLAVAILVGLVLGLGGAILRETLDTRIRSVPDLREVSDVALLGTIAFDSVAAKSPLITAIAPHAARAESFRVLRTNLQFVDVDKQQKVFVMSSAVPGEGKTTTSLNLAISLAQAGTRTLLLEGDLRRPRISERLGIDGAVGVTSVLVGKVKLGDAIHVHDDTGLEVLPCGPLPPNPSELLQSKAMAELVSEVRGEYDVVLIDAPPLLPVTDAALLATHADGTILVVRHARTTRDQIAGAVERLDQVDSAVVGLVLNMTPAKGRAYGYGYGYGYGPSHPPGAASSTRPGPDGRRRMRRRTA
jgi:capsular exopolysaccharide synthesis family protein